MERLNEQQLAEVVEILNEPFLHPFSKRNSETSRQAAECATDSMSGRADISPADFSNFREYYRECHLLLGHFRLLLAKDVDEFIGKETARASRQKYGTDQINEYFAAVQNALWKALCKEHDLDRRFAYLLPADKEKALEFFCIWMATEAVRRIKSIHALGLADALQNGDESGVVLALMRFKRFRERSEIFDYQRRLSFSALERNRNDLILKLAKVRERPPLNFSDIPRDRIEAVLLARWDTPQPLPNGKNIPPLCYFTDKALASLFQIVFRQRNLKPDTVRKKWARLGLLKARLPEVVEIRGRRL